MQQILCYYKTLVLPTDFNAKKYEFSENFVSATDLNNS